MTTDPLRAALAEALHGLFWYDLSHDADGCIDMEADSVERILAHPAVLAALDRSDPAVGLQEALLHYATRVYQLTPHGTERERAERVMESVLAATPTASPTPPATAEHALLVSSGWEFTGYDRGSPTYRRTPTASPTATGEDSDA